MTKRREDSHSTEFGLWLRKQPEIDSGIGFVTTNIDWMWSNYKTDLWMLVEEKRHRTMPERWQIELYQKLDALARNDPNYRGFHLLVFQNTNPEDGYTWLDGRYGIERAELISFLRFELPDTQYMSYFPERDLVRLHA